MAKTRSTSEESWEELVRNADGTIPDPVGFGPSERVEIETRYLDKTAKALKFPLDHVYCLHESDFAVALNPDLDVGKLVLTSHETWDEHRFRVTMPDAVTDEFYERLEMYERVSPERFGVEQSSVNS
ncbi:hypothetical protein [Halorubrum sp. AJ67]|uniref:hypothetical protein n=1 Tax=Halorubrum sp. AJ67 TaxID=1173487 RepID=UPI0003DC440E|nr:hypothetical protein [Halorubrum sp. AJ67]CDK38656.1 uncharacterized protein domain protein [Halorubrum sp. AJ67]